MMNFDDPEFCRRAADYLSTLPKEQFVEGPLTFFSGEIKEPCGTIACAAGHLVISPLNKKDFLPTRNLLARECQDLLTRWRALFSISGYSPYDSELFGLVSFLPARSVALYRLYRAAGDMLPEALRNAGGPEALREELRWGAWPTYQAGWLFRKYSADPERELFGPRGVVTWDRDFGTDQLTDHELAIYRVLRWSGATPQAAMQKVLG